ncbi:Imm52 family immunity protein [Caballeronia sp. AZ10_KS36]|uniref:Imm52 family immunity protein n=1 Tax=Caballeronia sp. AZ10_KS36 TaxID=2921757 RepID=UPI0020291BF0|nr:Imm52 family immunity protein [Caballeronia sp. AZ10_KS36]
MSGNEENLLSVELGLRFKLDADVLPSAAKQCEDLWKFARVLETHSFSLDQWLLDGEANRPAFTDSGPSEDFIDPSSLADEEDRYKSVWNGREGQGGAGFRSWYYLWKRSSFDFRADGNDVMKYYHVVADIIEKALKIWPGILVEVGSYSYSASHKVFKDRPGVGWMLYLPRRIEFEQVPEARLIRHVKDLNGTEGTIIISEIDGPFDVDNPEHVKVANAIEIRLADQDLLPRYVDL